jgi:demethylmenaquinone methyltransferase/2-methoxy-6-polyprenyl-1,4-benzoquinol methylase
MNIDQIQYYSERAKEYEQIYLKPERQENLKNLRIILKDLFFARSVFEIACGTGYWTQFISETAKSIFAIDINETVIEIARSKNYKCPTTFEKRDIFKSTYTDEKFESGFGGFIWSHIPKQEKNVFITKFISNISPGGLVVFTDNQYVEGSNTPIDSKDYYGNTYQIRKLSNGSSYKVMKNFPADKEILDIIDPIGDDIEIERLKYFWVLRFKVRKVKQNK